MKNLRSTFRIMERNLKASGSKEKAPRTGPILFDKAGAGLTGELRHEPPLPE